MKTKILKLFKRELFRIETYSDDDIQPTKVKRKDRVEGGILEMTPDEVAKENARKTK